MIFHNVLQTTTVSNTFENYHFDQRRKYQFLNEELFRLFDCFQWTAQSASQNSKKKQDFKYELRL